MQQEINEQEKIDWYLAQIACEIRKANSKNPKRFKTKQFLIQFTKPAPPPKTPQQQVAQVSKSKSAWLAACGLTNKIKK